MANDDLQDIWMKVGNRTFPGLRGKALKFNRVLSPSRVNSLPKGTDFTIEVDPAGILIGLLRTAVQKVREAALKGDIFDVKFKSGGGNRTLKLEALDIKQRVANGGQGFTIKLRKG